MKKLNSRRGETLGEVLVALLIVSLTFLFLTGAVISAARVNDAIRTESAAFKPDTGTGTDLNVKVGGIDVPVKLHKAGEYYYYD